MSTSNPTLFPKENSLNMFWLKLFIRRGTAKCQLGDFSGACEDYEKAVAIDGENEELKVDFARMKKLKDVSVIKALGDSLFGSGDAGGAVAKYTEALELDDNFVSAVSNRAGAFLAMGQNEKCIKDCSAALNLLSNVNEATGPVPPPGSDKRRDWVIKTMCRRGKAKSEIEEFEGAVRDMKLAFKLVPEGRIKVRDELQDDIEAIEEFLK